MRFYKTPQGTMMRPVKPAQHRSPYCRFAVMVAASTVVMFGLMYLNTYDTAHVFFSQTRAWMAVVMGSSMAAVMLGFMTHMLKNRAANVGILVGSAVVFAMSLWLVRSQSTVDDVSYLKAMIPHHSIAILTSTRADIRDERVRALADAIAQTQKTEIAQMSGLIRELEAAD